MEPVDPRMGGLLDGAGSGGPDELRSIVSRAGRRRARLAAVGAGLALAAGGGIGYGVASATGGGSGQQVVATAPVYGPSGASAANGAAPAVGRSSIAVPLSKLQSLFTRQVGSIDVRGFLSSAPAPLPHQGVYSCNLGGPSFQAEVSTPHMVGVASGFIDQQATGGVITDAQASVLGELEGDPTVVVVAHTASNVAQVKMAFAGGSVDQMAPVQGWSALAAPFTAGTKPADTIYGTLTAFDHAGKLLQTVSVPSPEPNPPPSGSGSTGAGSSGTGSTGSGSTGSGSASSGTVHAAGGAVSSPPATDSPTSPPPTTKASSPAQGSVAYPCRVPPPTPVPACAPPSTSNGGAYTCSPTPLPAETCSMPAGSGPSSASCAPVQPTPSTTSANTLSPNSGSGG